MAVVWAEEDTEHQGYKGQQRQAEPQVGHVVLPLRLGQAVGQSWLQAHKQHTGGEGNASSDIVKNFGIIHLSHEERRKEKKEASRSGWNIVNGTEGGTMAQLLRTVVNWLFFVLTVRKLSQAFW